MKPEKSVCRRDVSETKHPRIPPGFLGDFKETGPDRPCNYFLTISDAEYKESSENVFRHVKC